MCEANAFAISHMLLLSSSRFCPGLFRNEGCGILQQVEGHNLLAAVSLLLLFFSF